jgi:hypothetical protein
MSFCENCVKRQAYFKKGRRHLVSKSPGLCAKIDSLFEHFPDCRIIYLVRTPLEVVPSTHSTIGSVWSSLLSFKQ